MWAIAVAVAALDAVAAFPTGRDTETDAFTGSWSTW